MKKFLLISIAFIGIIASLFFGTNVFTKPITEVPVLLYHNVLDSEEVPAFLKEDNGNFVGTVVSTKKFEHQMDILKKNNYNILTLDEFFEFVNGNKKIYKKSVLITFDDGLQNNYTLAYPILKKNNFNAVVFLITGTIGKPTSVYPLTKQDTLRPMTQDQIEQTKDVFEFACHTHNMHNRDKIKNIPADLIRKTDDEIRKDLKQSLSYDIKPYFAYPFGKYKSNIYPILQELEVKAAFTTKPGAVKVGDSVYDLKRNGISENTTDDEFMKIIGK